MADLLCITDKKNTQKSWIFREIALPLHPLNNCRDGGMVDTRDLKSLDQKWLCGFESRSRHLPTARNGAKGECPLAALVDEKEVAHFEQPLFLFKHKVCLYHIRSIDSSEIITHRDNMIHFFLNYIYRRNKLYAPFSPIAPIQVTITDCFSNMHRLNFLRTGKIGNGTGNL